MSDEYASSDYKGSLVNDSVAKPARDTTYRTGNYPPSDDTTSSGGYGSQTTWSNAAQRGRADSGLVDQSTNGGPIGEELQDAKQGEDDVTREEFRHEAERDFAKQSLSGPQGLNPYGRNVDSRSEAADMLASGYRDMRGRQYESGPATSNDGDVDAM